MEAVSISDWQQAVVNTLLLRQGRIVLKSREKCPPFLKEFLFSFFLLVMWTAVGTCMRAPPSGLPDATFNEVSFIVTLGTAAEPKMYTSKRPSHKFS